MNKLYVVWWGLWIVGMALVAASWLGWVTVTIGWIGFAIGTVGFVGSRIPFLNRQEQAPTRPAEDDASSPQ